jgi:hypoxia-inducible factor (prolyl hydroxylase)
MHLSGRSALIDITFIDAHLFLCESTGSRPSTRWVFLDQLAKDCGVPLAACELVGDFSAAMHSITAEADSLRDAGMVGHHQELVSQIEHLREQRAECLQSSIRRSASRIKPSAVRLGPSSSSLWDVAAVAAELKREHCCVIDDFVGADEAAPLREHLGSMRSSGALKPGEVSAGLQQQRRGDLMAWVSTEAGAQAPPLRALLHSIDRLVGALGQQPLVADDLGPQRMLCRHEMQVTCYPGNGARYVKHVDDPHGSRGRVLTLIAYSNPQWEPGHGGALRLHVPSGARDVEPRDRRLVLFWSDARAPHEVLPAHRERYAVSVWFSDAQAVAAALSSKSGGGDSV